MSKSTTKCHLSQTKGIPIRRVVLNDPSQLPSDYSSTPGGTIFSTTPGGTRIIYDRAFLMHLRNSPMTKSPPPNLPKIPGVTSPLAADAAKDEPRENGHEREDSSGLPDVAEEPQFEMDI